MRLPENFLFYDTVFYDTFSIIYDLTLLVTFLFPTFCSKFLHFLFFTFSSAKTRQKQKNKKQSIKWVNNRFECLIIMNVCFVMVQYFQTHNSSAGKTLDCISCHWSTKRLLTFNMYKVQRCPWCWSSEKPCEGNYIFPCLQVHCVFRIDRLGIINAGYYNALETMRADCSLTTSPVVTLLPYRRQAEFEL